MSQPKEEICIICRLTKKESGGHTLGHTSCCQACFEQDLARMRHSGNIRGEGK